MEVTKCEINGLLIIKPNIIKDERGSFCETYNKTIIKEQLAINNIDKCSLLIDNCFIQDNQSVSIKGVLRGLHFQNPPFEQGKLIRVAKGSVKDVVVDIRNNSQSYGKHFSVILSEENGLMLWVPPGFAHGFLTLEDNTMFMYKCTQVYNKESEGSILWNDPDLGIDWGLEAGTSEIQHPNSNFSLIISEKDRTAPRFKDLNSKF